MKRILRIKYKIDYPGAISHITQRAPGRELLFLEEADYLYMLHLIKEKSKKFNFDIFNFTFLPNHLHLQIRSNKENLSEGMKNLFETYAFFFNRKYQRKGHVFCGVFRQALCFDDLYLLATSLYIHLNALKAGLATDPAKYRWSSCNLYIDQTQKKAFIDYKFILRTLDEDINTAMQMYKDLLYESALIKIGGNWRDLNVVGKFKEFIRELLPKNFSNKSLNERYDVLKELDEKVAELKGKGRLRSPQSLLARKFLIEQLKAQGYNITEIAQKLGVSRQSIYVALKLTKTSRT